YELRTAISFPTEPQGLESITTYGRVILVQVICIQAVFYLNRLYHGTRNIGRVDRAYAVFSAVSVGALLSIAFSTLLFKNTVFEVDYSRTIVVYAWVLTIVFVLLGRGLHSRVIALLRGRGIGLQRLLVLGLGDAATVVIQKVTRSRRLGYKLVGLVGGTDAPSHVLGVPVIGHSDDLQELVEAYEIDEVIIARPDATREELLGLIARCQHGSVSVKVIPDVYEIMAGEVSVDDLGGLPLLTVRDIALRGWRMSLKRIVDLIISAAGMILLSPLMMLVAGLIKFGSDGPVFFFQNRVGLDGKDFKIFKFRSMRTDASEERQWTVAEDPRRTGLGRFIRRFSIDELPQLINVVLGDMSLVGPRPEQPQFVEHFQERIPRYMERHREKAGITGWAQVNGLRGDTSIEDRTRYDLWYVENWSLWLDVKIILRTVFQVLSGRAY
ncbi:MAG: undecaprenyl-phosphate glucose phosphotransferase, partial [Anaerolineales bacterium]|nr:undecaprenyl-phosphate glucose phosphotransferase [Anaerolineales bacterium]